MTQASTWSGCRLAVTSTETDHEETSVLEHDHVRIVGEKSNCIWRPPRKVQRLEPSRQFAIRHDETGWCIQRRLGRTIQDGFETNAAALHWINTDRNSHVDETNIQAVAIDDRNVVKEDRNTSKAPSSLPS